MKVLSVKSQNARLVMSKYSPKCNTRKARGEATGALTKVPRRDRATRPNWTHVGLIQLAKRQPNNHSFSAELVDR
jgi:hypothetical protein